MTHMVGHDASGVLGTAGGLLGAVIGFVILAEGIKLIRSSQKGLYQKNGYKIHPMSKLPKYKQSKGLISGGTIKFPNIKIKI